MSEYDYDDPEEVAPLVAGKIFRMFSHTWEDFKEHPPIEVTDMTKWCVCTDWRGAYDISLMDESNAQVVAKELGDFDTDQVVFDHVYYWQSCIFVKIWNADGSITDAFNTLMDLINSATNEGYIDDTDFYNREWEALREAITNEGRRFVGDQYEDNPHWPGAVAEWLNKYAPDSETENSDGTGAYPSDEWIRLTLYDLEIADEETTDDVENCIITNIARDRNTIKGADGWLVSRQVNMEENRVRWVERSAHRTDSLSNIHGNGETFCIFCSEDITDTTDWAYKFNYPNTADYDFAHIRCCHMRLDFEQYIKDWGKLNRKFAEWLKAWKG